MRPVFQPVRRRFYYALSRAERRHMEEKSLAALAEEIAGDFSDRFDVVINDGTHSYSEYRLLYALTAEALIRNIRNNSPQ